MLEYFLLIILLLPLVGKKARRRFNLRKVRITSTVVIGALASLSTVKGVGTSATTNTLRVMSVEASYGITELGAAIDDGFSFGWAHSDYTAAEIEECLEATLSMDIGNKIAQEQANRLVRQVGMINTDGTPIAGGGLRFDNGKMVKTRLNWALAIGDTLDLWVRNASGTVYTTGASILANGHIWVKD